MRRRRTAVHRMVGGLGVTQWVGDDAAADDDATSPELTVVLVPGAMDRAGGFVRAVRHVEATHVVAYDRRGYARSRELAPSSHLADHVDDLLAVVADVATPVTIVGHSQGALIALHAALRISAAGDGADDAMRAVRSVGAWEPPTPWFDWYDTTSGRAVHDAISGERSPAEIAESFLRSAISDRLWERLPAAMRAERLAEGPALVADITASRRPDAPLDLRSITLPVVVGYGSHTAPQHRRSSELAAAEIPGARLIAVDGANHGVHLGHPEAFAEFIDAAVALATG